MIDITTISILAGIITLLIERMFAWMNKIKKSSCCGSEIEREVLQSK